MCILTYAIGESHCSMKLRANDVSRSVAPSGLGCLLGTLTTGLRPRLLTAAAPRLPNYTAPWLRKHAADAEMGPRRDPS